MGVYDSVSVSQIISLVSRDDATAQRKVKKKSMTENEIAKHIMGAAFPILLKHGFKRVVNRLEEP